MEKGGVEGMFELPRGLWRWLGIHATDLARIRALMQERDEKQKED